MSVSINNVLSLFNTYFGDDTEERVSDVERLRYISESATDIKQTMKSSMSNMTYPLTYIPGIHSYKISPGIYNVLAAGDMRVENSTYRIDDLPITIESASKLDEDIKKGRYNNAYALDRYDGDLYLMMSYMPEGIKTSLSTFAELEPLTELGDTATIEVDNNVSQETSSIKATVDVSASGDNLAGVSSVVSLDLTNYKDIGVVAGHLYLTDKTNIESVTIKLGTDASNYYSFNTTNAFNETGFINEWNRIVVEWKNATVVGAPDVADINVFDVIVNYEVGQTDTVIRFDDFFISKPIDLTFHYISYSVGKNSAGTELLEFTDITDIPYYSGQYDNLKYVNARMAAALAFYDLRRNEEAQIQEFKANQKMKQIRTLVPSNHRKELKAFRPTGATMKRRFRNR